MNCFALWLCLLFGFGFGVGFCCGCGCVCLCLFVRGVVVASISLAVRYGIQVHTTSTNLRSFFLSPSSALLFLANYFFLLLFLVEKKTDVDSISQSSSL